MTVASPGKNKPATFAELPALLASAPHRVLFLAGAIAVLLSMAWWAVELSWMFGMPLGAWPQPTIPPAYGHSMLIQYGTFPLFMFGFLLTVFPRWMSQPALTRRHYVPVAGCVFGGYVLANVGLLDLPRLLELGFVLMLVGYLLGIYTLARVLRAATNRIDHAKSCLLALSLGALGLILFLGLFVWRPGRVRDTGHPDWHVRLVVADLFYRDASHAAVFQREHGIRLPGHPATVELADGVGAAAGTPAAGLAWCARLVVARRCAAGLGVRVAFADLAAVESHATRAIAGVLHLAFAWLPVAFVLYAVQDVIYADQRQLLFVRAPLHALAIGFSARCWWRWSRG